MPFNYDLLRQYARGEGLEQEDSPAAGMEYYVMVSNSQYTRLLLMRMPAARHIARAGRRSRRYDGLAVWGGGSPQLHLRAARWGRGGGANHPSCQVCVRIVLHLLVGVVKYYFIGGM